MIPRAEIVKLLTSVAAMLPAHEVDRLMRELERLACGWVEVNLTHLYSASSPYASCIDCWLQEYTSSGADVRLYVRQKQPMPRHSSIPC